jgi:4-alpha-glucanotransferase
MIDIFTVKFYTEYCKRASTKWPKFKEGLMDRASGLLVHPTSFPGNYGIGDLGAGAYAFIDFMHEAKQRLWQILPLGPTGYGDSPYQSFSTFAGNHYLISPDLLLEEGYLTPQDLEDVPQFNDEAVDYGPVIEYKMGLLKKAFARFEPSAEYNKF